MKTKCEGCCLDIECECIKECDEEFYCHKHGLEEQEYWYKYFGLDKCKTKQEYLNQLKLMDPRPDYRTREQMIKEYQDY